MKNARHGLANPNARYRKEVSVEDVLASAVVSDPLHLLDICATSDGAAAVVLTSRRTTPRGTGSPSPVRVSAISTVTPTFPQHRHRHAATSPPTRPTAVAAPERTFKESIAHAAYEEAGIGPEDVSLAEVYDLSTALELDWIEDLALCKRGEAEQLLRAGDTTIGGRIPVNPSRRAGLLRRGGAGPGAGPGVRGDLAAARSGRGPPGRGRPGRHHRQPGPVRPRLVGAAERLTALLLDGPRRTRSTQNWGTCTGTVSTAGGTV